MSSQKPLDNNARANIHARTIIRTNTENISDNRRATIAQ